MSNTQGFNPEQTNQNEALHSAEITNAMQAVEQATAELRKAKAEKNEKNIVLWENRLI